MIFGDISTICEPSERELSANPHVYPKLAGGLLCAAILLCVNLFIYFLYSFCLVWCLVQVWFNLTVDSFDTITIVCLSVCVWCGVVCLLLQLTNVIFPCERFSLDSSFVDLLSVFSWNRIFGGIFGGQHESSTELCPTYNYVCRLFFGACLPHTDTDIYNERAHTHTPKFTLRITNVLFCRLIGYRCKPIQLQWKLDRKNEYFII